MFNPSIRCCGMVLVAAVLVTGCGRRTTVVERQEVVVREPAREPVREVIVREREPVREIVVVRPEPPPPPRQREAPPPAPASEYVWVDGAYEWIDGAWEWVPGRWVRPARESAVWVPGRWVPASGGYVWEPGHWR
jgi:hypothetical protein